MKSQEGRLGQPGSGDYASRRPLATDPSARLETGKCLTKAGKSKDGLFFLQ